MACGRLRLQGKLSVFFEEKSRYKADFKTERFKNVTSLSKISVFIVCIAVFGLPLLPQSNSELFAAALDDQVLSNEEDNAPPKKKRASFGRAFLGISTVIIPGTAWYYWDHSNKRDQLLTSKEDFIRRYTTFREWKFDDNIFETNAVSHPLAGSMYFLSARCNGFNQWQSLLFAIGGSLIWEMLIEYREIISINDSIHTPLGGYAIGEPLFQLASFYAANSSSNWFSRWVSSMTDVNQYKYRDGVSRDGSLSKIYHSIYAAAGLGLNDSNYATLNFGLHAELFGIQNLKQRGKTGGFAWDSPYTKADLNGALGIKGIDEMLFFMETGILGWYKQNISENEKGRSGYSFFVSLNSSMDYSTRVFSGFHDKLGIIHLLGNSIDISLFRGICNIRIKNALFFDFALVHSAGLKGYYKNGHTTQDVAAKGQLTASNQGYYYGYGLTDILKVTADIGSFQVGTDFIFNKYWSINPDGITNREPKTHNSFKLTDGRMTVKAHIQYNTKRHMAYRISGYFAFMDGYADGSYKKAYGKKFEIAAIYRTW